MRLIDADALNIRIDKCVGIDCLGLEPVMAIRDVKALISVMPTIDAIPVEWLKKVRDIYLKSYHAGHECDLHTAVILNDLITDWRKEQKA